MNIPVFTKSNLPRGKARLAAVLRVSKEFVTVDTASSALGVDRRYAARILARWAEQGLLRRIRRGLYAPVSLAAFGSDQVLEDPWSLVPELFSPGYVGGWSAAEHWDLTEQIFRSICVLTTKPMREKERNLQGASFIIKRIAEKKLFDLKPVWRGQTKVMVSSPARTIIDMLDDPSLGGGIRHVSECLNAYLARADADTSALIGIANQLGNGAVFKRLGFLASRRPGCESLAEKCREHLTQGNANLDPSVPCKSLVKRWRLWIPLSWKGEKNI